MLRVRGLFLPVRTLALLLSEVLVMSLAFYLFVTPADEHLLLNPLLPVGLSAQFSVVLATLTIVAMVAAGLYNSDAFVDYRAMLARILLVLALEFPMILTASFLYRNFVSAAAPPWSGWYLKAVLALFACLLVTRAGFLLLADSGALKRRVVVIGAGERASRIKELAERVGGAHFVPAAFIAAPKDHRRVVDCTLTLGDAFDADALFRFTARCGAAEIVVATDDRRGLPVKPLLGCKARGVAITEFLSFCERESGRVDLDALQPSWLIFSDGFRMSLTARSVKRLFDIVVSTAMLVLTLPLLLLTALAIKLEDGGSVIYTQERVGLFGRPFTLLKFRSMREDAEPFSRPQWAEKRDSRVTRVGSVIRKVRIDELPQLINVLKGDMSFIGPRPERPYFVEQLMAHIPFYGERHAVKPGITGWAQINYPYGASLQDARNKLSYDLYYVKNHTLLLDFIVLIQTVRVILFPEGAR
jgi:sugar transferase (PEP-CTERM system associated)